MSDEMTPLVIFTRPLVVCSKCGPFVKLRNDWKCPYCELTVHPLRKDDGSLSKFIKDYLGRKKA